MPDPTVGGDNAVNNDDTNKMDDSEVRMDLTDDLLHMVGIIGNSHKSSHYPSIYCDVYYLYRFWL